VEDKRAAAEKKKIEEELAAGGLLEEKDEIDLAAAQLTGLKKAYTQKKKMTAE
jgi:glycerol-3-phosphate responsive antiterminator